MEKFSCAQVECPCCGIELDSDVCVFCVTCDKWLHELCIKEHATPQVVHKRRDGDFEHL